MQHKMNLYAEPFRAIKFGYKTIELRLYDEKRQLIQIGDTIEFTSLDNPSEAIIKQVVSLHKFESFEQLYKNLPLLKCGYTPSDIQSASSKDMEIYYSIEKQSKYGVVGIEFEEEPLQRFLVAQTGVLEYCSSYETALNEIKNGHKETHWMWYIFPQIKGLSSDPVTEYFALKNLYEVEEYISNPILFKRLTEITGELLKLDSCDPVAVMGIMDAYKLRSCMTLFSEIATETDVFDKVLEKYCIGTKDDKTLRRISIE